MTWNSKFSDIKFNAYSDLTNVEGKFNIIVLSHVLEHVVNPIDYLKLVNNLLVKNGILYIEVPFLDYQYKGEFFPHLLFFKPQSLQNLCDNVGFRVIDVQSFGKSKEKSPLNGIRHLYEVATKWNKKIKNRSIERTQRNQT